MTEVSLFTERREIIQVTDSAQIKERLMDTFEPSPRPRPRMLTTRQQLSYAGRAGRAGGHRTRAGRAGAVEPELVEPGPADVLVEGEGHTPHPPHASEFLDPPLA
jgi:hypothetical protein